MKKGGYAFGLIIMMLFYLFLNACAQKEDTGFVELLKDYTGL